MADPQSPEEKKEAAAIRRRWITLGELLAVAAVVISGLTFWNSYRERSGAEAERAADAREKQAEKGREAAKAQILMLKASGSGKRLSLAALDADQAIQSQTLLFPSALARKPIDMVDPRIEAGWVEDAAKKAGKQAKGAGDARLPVAITTRFIAGGETHSDSAIYDIGYRLDEGLLDTDVELLGLSLVRRVKSPQAQRSLDELWAGRR